MITVMGRDKPGRMNRTTVLTEHDRKRFHVLPGRASLERELSRNTWHNTIYQGDAIELLRLLPNACIDLVFADPPYNKGKDFGNNKDRRSPEAYRRWSERWIREAVRVLKNTGSMYVCCDWTYSGMVQEIIARDCIIRNRITWKREKGRGAKTNWKNNMEDIWFATKSDTYRFNVDAVKVKKEIIAPYRVNGKPKDWIEHNGERYRMTYPSNIWTDLVVPFWSMRENTPHPAQKPERLVERIIAASSNKGDLVLDPFIGSGTTAVTAHRTARSYIGFELNDDYIRLALKRLGV